MQISPEPFTITCTGQEKRDISLILAMVYATHFSTADEREDQICTFFVSNREVDMLSADIKAMQKA
jgi:hypothetical protein